MIFEFLEQHAYIIGILLILISIYITFHKSSKIRSYKRTQEEKCINMVRGKIIGVFHTIPITKSKYYRDFCNIVCKYEVNNLVYKVRTADNYLYYYDRAKKRLGDEVTIMYNSLNPEEFYIKENINISSEGVFYE